MLTVLGRLPSGVTDDASEQTSSPCSRRSRARLSGLESRTNGRGSPRAHRARQARRWRCRGSDGDPRRSSAWCCCSPAQTSPISCCRRVARGHAIWRCEHPWVRRAARLVRQLLTESLAARHRRRRRRRHHRWLGAHLPLARGDHSKRAAAVDRSASRRPSAVVHCVHHDSLRDSVRIGRPR